MYWKAFLLSIAVLLNHNMNIIIEECKNNKCEKMECIAVGDLLLHDSLYKDFEDAEREQVFKEMFSEVTSYFDKADLVLGNFEGTCYPDMPLSSYPQFNVPKSFIYALKAVGFDGLCTVNNHCLDTGVQGLLSTNSLIRQSGMIPFGTGDQQSNKKSEVVVIKGIKVGLIGFSDFFNGLEANLSEEEKNYYLSIYNKQQIIEEIKDMKDLGVDIVLVYLHWGQEYALEPLLWQQEDMQEFMAQGVEVILGSHPHVLGQSKMLFQEDHNTGYIYSMGNFISDQFRDEYGLPRFTEAGVMVRFHIEKNDKATKIIDWELIPTWLYHYYDNEGKYRAKIIPLENIEKNPYNFSDENFRKALEAKWDSFYILQGETKNIMDEYSVNQLYNPNFSTILYSQEQ